MRYLKDQKNTVLYKTSLKDEVEFFELDLTHKNSDVSSLPLAYDEELPITVGKKKRSYTTTTTDSRCVP